MNEEIKAIVENSETKTISTISGEKISLPKLTLGNELKIGCKFNEIIEESGISSPGSADVFKAIFKSESSLDKLLGILEIMIGKEKKFIEDNFDMEGMVSFVLPFFIKKVTALTEAMLKVTPNIEMLTEKIPDIH